MNIIKKFFLSTIGATFLSSGTVYAGVIVGANNVNASIPDLNSSFSINELINQDGLSANYISGVTDFNSFVSTTTHASASSSFGGGWASTTLNTFPASIDFDLGSIFNITSLALWNDTDTQGLGNFEVFASADNSFTSLTSLGTFVGSVAIANVTPAQVFNTIDTTTQYIRVHGSPINYNNGLLNIGEIAFEASQSVPEPSVLALMGLGFLGFAATRRKSQK